MPPVYRPAYCQRYRTTSGLESLDTNIISETTVNLMVNGEPWLSFACTPTDLEALAIGFLYNEGIIENRDDLAIVEVCEQGITIDVWLNKSVKRPERWQRTSGCTGGFTSIPQSSMQRSITHHEHIPPETLLSCMEQVFQSQEIYREAGGIHTSILSDGQQILARAEDIGRHNTLDKLAGRMLLDGIKKQSLILATTGRISAEMLQKSARLGAVAIVSRTSPTSQSVAAAEQLGITLVGYARRDAFLVYSNAWRLTPNSVGAPVPPPGGNLPGGSG